MRRLLLAVALIALAQGARAQTGDAAQLVVRLQALEAELAQLRGEVEALGFRLRQLEGAGPTAPAPSAANGVAPSAFGQPGPAPSATTLGGGAAGPETTLDRPALPPGFDLGMALLQAGRYTEARAELDRFVAANPEDPRAAEAAFWSAETVFVAGDYSAAAAAFAANYRTYGPDAPYAADTLLKVAMALTANGDQQRACLTLDELARRHTGLGRSLEAGVTRARERADCP